MQSKYGVPLLTNKETEYEGKENTKTESRQIGGQEVRASLT